MKSRHLGRNYLCVPKRSKIRNENWSRLYLFWYRCDLFKSMFDVIVRMQYCRNYFKDMNKLTSFVVIEDIALYFKRITFAVPLSIYSIVIPIGAPIYVGAQTKYRFPFTDK